jgi:phytoene dehydrogenase-like protein
MAFQPGAPAKTARDVARESAYDAIVVGAGPNGLCAAIAFAREGLTVLLIEAADSVGGGARSQELTLPGFVHDVCSAIHPMARISPFLRSVRALKTRLEWIQPPAAVAHPLDGGDLALLEPSLDVTASALGDDGPAWRALHAPIVNRADTIFSDLLGPPCWPRDPLGFVSFGLSAMRPATSLASERFSTVRARALFAGCAAHSFLPLSWPFSAAFGLVLSAAGHVVGWPFPRGGSQRLSDALAEELQALGGEIVTGTAVRSLSDLPDAKAVLFDVAPSALARIAKNDLPSSYRRRLCAFRHGPGAFKLDWALDGPIPWQNPRVARAATVHVGGALDEIARSEQACWSERASSSPFVLLAQPSLFDATRAPPGKHTAWAYCHVPSGSVEDCTEAIERQIERFAPGFRDRILARSARGPREMERDNANLVGGDISGGSNDLTQLLTRPVIARVPYATPNPRLFLCSASTPPGGGVHGMCGWHSARTALRRVFDRNLPRTPRAL